MNTIVFVCMLGMCLVYAMALPAPKTVTQGAVAAEADAPSEPETLEGQETIWGHRRRYYGGYGGYGGYHRYPYYGGGYGRGYGGGYGGGFGGGYGGGFGFGYGGGYGYGK